MAQTVLEQLLERRLIPVEDDPTLEKVQATADEIAKRIQTAKIPATLATLVALDAQASPTEPLGDPVMVELRKHWKSVDQKHPDRPMTLVRGILADALHQAGKDPAVAAAVTLTARSYWPFTTLHAEVTVWEGLLRALGERAEAAAVESWRGNASGTSIDVPSVDLGSVRAQAGKLDVALLQQHLSAAAGPASNPPAGVAANGVAATPQGYSLQAGWVDNFGKIAAEGLGVVLNTTLQATAKSIDLTNVAKSIEEVAQSLAVQIDAAIQPIHAAALRTEVLLWRESLYCTSLRCGYRRLAPAVRVIAQAYDLHTIIPAHSPLAVESLLEEAVRAIGDEEGVTVVAFLEELMKDLPLELASVLGKAKPLTGRSPLLGVIREAAAEGNPPSVLDQRLGINTNTIFPLHQLTLWVFRDLQADRLLSAR